MPRGNLDISRSGRCAGHQALRSVLTTPTRCTPLRIPSRILSAPFKSNVLTRGGSPVQHSEVNRRRQTLCDPHESGLDPLGAEWIECFPAARYMTMYISHSIPDTACTLCLKDEPAGCRTGTPLIPRVLDNTAGPDKPFGGGWPAFAEDASPREPLWTFSANNVVLPQTVPSVEHSIAKNSSTKYAGVCITFSFHAKCQTGASSEVSPLRSMPAHRRRPLRRRRRAVSRHTRYGSSTSRDVEE